MGRTWEVFTRMYLPTYWCLWTDLYVPLFLTTWQSPYLLSCFPHTYKFSRQTFSRKLLMTCEFIPSAQHSYIQLLISLRCCPLLMVVTWKHRILIKYGPPSSAILSKAVTAGDWENNPRSPYLPKTLFALDQNKFVSPPTQFSANSFSGKKYCCQTSVVMFLCASLSRKRIPRWCNQEGETDSTFGDEIDTVSGNRRRPKNVIVVSCWQRKSELQVGVSGKRKVVLEFSA